MEGVGGGNFEEVAVTVEIHVLRLGYGRFQRIFVADPGQAAPTSQPVPGESCRSVRGSERRVLVPGEELSGDRLFRESAKQASVQCGCLSMGFSEPFFGGVS